MLITNYRYNTNLCGHYFAGETNPLWIIRPHTMRGYYMPSQVSDNIEQIKRDSFPTGTNPPYSIVVGDKGALLSSTTLLNADSDLTGNLSNGINIISNLDGTSSLTANLSLITSMIASLTGSSSVTAALVGVVQCASSLSGTGNLNGGLNIVAYLQSALSGTTNITASLRGTLGMEADIFVNQSQATVDEIVAGVWNAIAADFNTAGTMGNKLNSAGSSGDPWSTILPGTYTGDQAGAIVDRLEDLIKQVKALTAAGL